MHSLFVIRKREGFYRLFGCRWERPASYEDQVTWNEGSCDTYLFSIFILIFSLLLRVWRFFSYNSVMRASYESLIECTEFLISPSSVIVVFAESNVSLGGWLLETRLKGILLGEQCACTSYVYFSNFMYISQQH